MIQEINSFQYEKVFLQYDDNYQFLPYPWIEDTTIKLFTPSNQTYTYITLKYIRNRK